MAETKLNAPEGKNSILSKLSELSKADGKKRLYVLLAVLGIVSVIAVIVNFSLYQARHSDPPVAGNEEVPPGVTDDVAALLPQLERFETVAGTRDKQVPDKTVDPFAQPMELLGIVQGGPGNDLAIIKARQTTYIAGPGDKIAGDWEITAINRNSVQLNREEKEIMLELAPKN